MSPGRDAARGAAHQLPALGDRWQDHPGPSLRVSHRISKRIKEVFGRGEEIGGMRRTLLCGLDRRP
jgi:hypothetical protein